MSTRPWSELRDTVMPDPERAARVEAGRLTLTCRCVWLGERCPNPATEEDGMCDWCAGPGMRTEEQLRTNPKALIGPDGEYMGLGGAGELHDAPLADAKGYGPPKACWYDLDNRTLA
jgi:hypothetical protein